MDAFLAHRVAGRQGEDGNQKLPCVMSFNVLMATSASASSA